MSERGFFSASNDIKTLDGNIFSGFPWLTTHLLGARPQLERQTLTGREQRERWRYYTGGTRFVQSDVHQALKIKGLLVTMKKGMVFSLQK